MLILHYSVSVLVCPNGAFLSPTSLFQPSSQKSCSVLWMQISSDFYTALEVSENSIIILTHLNTMASRWSLWTPEWTYIKQKILHIRHQAHHGTSGELMSFMSCDMWNKSSHLQGMDMARDLLQQQCFMPDFEEFFMFCSKFPDELLCVTTLISILST